jgi:hypothetical protein
VTIKAIRRSGHDYRNNWAGLTIKWDNRDKQDVLHNDMAQMEQMPLRG